MEKKSQFVGLTGDVLYCSRRRNGKVLLVNRKRFRGALFLSIRYWYETTANTYKPTKNGITIPVEAFRSFRRAVRAVRQALEAEA